MGTTFIEGDAGMKVLTWLVMAALLSACSGGDTPASASPKKGTVSKDNVFKADVDAMAKAKGAEKIIQDAAEQQRQDIDAEQ